MTIYQFTPFMALYNGLAPMVDQYGKIANIAYGVNLVTKVANYTVLPSDSGRVFITGTGAVTFTLPSLVLGNGCIFTFICGVDANMVITAPSGKLVGDGNVANTSATFSTASHKIGGNIQVVCDGLKYYIVSTGNLTAIATMS